MSDSEIDLTDQTEDVNIEIINKSDQDKSKLITNKQQSKNFMIDNLLSSSLPSSLPSTLPSTLPQTLSQTLPLTSSSSCHQTFDPSSFPWQWPNPTTSRLNNDFYHAEKRPYSSNNVNFSKNNEKVDLSERMSPTDTEIVQDFGRLNEDLVKDKMEAGSSSADECYGNFNGNIYDNYCVFVYY